MNKFNTEERIEDVTNVSDGNDAYIDYRKFHYRNTVPDSRVLVFLTGFCIGMVFLFVQRKKHGFRRPVGQRSFNTAAKL